MIPDLARPAVITTLPSLNTTTDKREEMGRLTDECFNQSIYNEQKSKKKDQKQALLFLPDAFCSPDSRTGSPTQIGTF